MKSDEGLSEMVAGTSGMLLKNNNAYPECAPGLTLAQRMNSWAKKDG